MPLSSYYSLVAQVFECRRDRCDKAVVLEVARPGGLLWVAATMWVRNCLLLFGKANSKTWLCGRAMKTWRKGIKRCFFPGALN